MRHSTVIGGCENTTCRVRLKDRAPIAPANLVDVTFTMACPKVLCTININIWGFNCTSRSKARLQPYPNDAIGALRGWCLASNRIPEDVLSLQGFWTLAAEPEDRLIRAASPNFKSLRDLVGDQFTFRIPAVNWVLAATEITPLVSGACWALLFRFF
jgi:hypothetical protein